MEFHFMRHSLQGREINRIIIYSTKYLVSDWPIDECINRLLSATEVLAELLCADGTRAAPQTLENLVTRWPKKVWLSLDCPYIGTLHVRELLLYRFIFMKSNRVIFIWKVLHEASFWNRHKRARKWHIDSCQNKVWLVSGESIFI